MSINILKNLSDISNNNELNNINKYINIEELKSNFNIDALNNYAEKNNINKPEQLCKFKYYIKLLSCILTITTCFILVYLLYLYYNDINDGNVYRIYTFIKYIILFLTFYYFKDLILFLYKIYWNLIDDSDKLIIILTNISMILSFLITYYRNLALDNDFTKGKMELIVLLTLFTILSFYRAYPYYENIKQKTCNKIIDSFYYLNKFVKSEHILFMKTIINNMKKN